MLAVSAALRPVYNDESCDSRLEAFSVPEEGRSVQSPPSQLSNELVSALVRLVEVPEGGAAEYDPWRFRSLLRQILGEAWASVSRGEFAVLRVFLRGLVEAEEIVRPHLPDSEEPRVEAAREVYFTAYVLHIAEAFLRPEKTRARLGERQRSVHARNILKVLLANKEEYLRRAEILEAMEKIVPPPHPEPSRVSQILAELYNERLLMRIQGSAQGNAQTSFFTLSRQGLEVCQRLGLAEPPRLFEPDSTKWQHLLNPSRLGAGSNEKEREERIAVFYRPRPGLGCSLALAQCSRLLAAQVRSLSPSRVLVMDLEGEESSLQDHFGAQSRNCRGLAGMLEDYQEQTKEKRKDWLAQAIFSDKYTCKPRSEPELDNLIYLPPFQRKSGSDLFHLYSELIRDIRREVESQPRQLSGAPKFPETGFFGDLRTALREQCAKTLVQAPSGLGPGAYLATVLLAEELILFLHPSDPKRKNIKVVAQEVVGNCLWRGERERLTEPTLTFVFSPLPLKAGLNLTELIERLFLVGGEKGKENVVYRIVRLHFDEGLAWGRPLEWLRLERAQRHVSLLEAGYLNLVEGLHPDSSLVPTHWQNRERDMEERLRLQILESQLGAPARSLAGASAVSAPATLTDEHQLTTGEPVKSHRVPSLPKREPQLDLRNKELLRESLETLELVEAER